MHRTLAGMRLRSPTRRAAVVLSLSTILVCSGRAMPEDAVTRAIDKGLEYLIAQIQAQQVGQGGNNGVGQTALETYALVVAGVSVEHPLVRKNFEFLHSSAKRSNHTYTLACYAFALDAAISQIENDLLILSPRKIQLQFRDNPRIGAEYRPHLNTVVTTIAKGQNDRGSWRYNMGAKDFDNSNVQFAVLALGVGAKRSVPIDPEVWKGVMNHFVKGQQDKGPKTDERITMMTPSESQEAKDRVDLVPKERGKEKPGEKGKEGDGGQGRTVVKPENPEIGIEELEVFQRGWDYQNKGGATWNMTCSGLSSLLLVRDAVRRMLPPDGRESLNSAVRDGYGWLMGHWTPSASYYGIYSLEKVADIGGVRLFGSHDWYEEVSEFLVKEQRADGSWPGGKSHGENARVATSFALLVLNRATSLLTTNPASRIVISGRGGAKDPNDRSWVYVPDIDASVHYPTLLRQIRLRPSVKLIRFLRSIIKAYPMEWKGELIPEMARVRDSITSKSVRSVIEDYLEEITGHAYKDWEDYLKWHRRWERVMSIGMEQKKDRIPDLLVYYKSTNKSVPLKKVIAWALVQCKARDAIPMFLEDLSHEDGDVRLAAYNSFRAFFIDFPPPFNPAAPRSVRENQVAKIKEWYRQQATS